LRIRREALEKLDRARVQALEILHMQKLQGKCPIVKYRGVDLLIYYLDSFHEIEGRVLDYVRSAGRLIETLKEIDSSIIKVHWSALLKAEGKFIAELWVETKQGLLRALLSDHDKTTLLKLWDKIDEALREDYNNFIGIKVEVPTHNMLDEVIKFVEDESKTLSENIELLSKVHATQLIHVKRFIHLEPWEGLLIIIRKDIAHLYKAPRVVLKQIIPEIERRFRIEAGILDRNFLES